MYMKELTNEQFQKFYVSYKIKSIYQTIEYAHVMNKEKFDSIYVGLIEDDNVVAASLLLIEKDGSFKYAYAPRGFLIDYLDNNLLETFTKELKKFLSRKNIVAVKLSPHIIKNTYDYKHGKIIKNDYFENIFDNLKNLGYHHYGFNEFFESLKPRYEAVLDIEKPNYLIFKDLTKQLRTKIRSANKIGIKIHKGTKNHLKYLYMHTKKKFKHELKYYEECYEQFNKTKSIEFFYAKMDTSYYLQVIQQKYIEQEEICLQNNEALLTSRNNDKIINKKIDDDKKLNIYKKDLIKATKLLESNPDGIILASAMVIKQNDTVYLFIDGYDPNYKNLNAKHLLLWQLCDKYSKEGYKSFNLGALAGINTDEKNPYKGLNDFKLNFNAKIVEYLGDLELVANNTLYFMYQNTRPIKNILKK